jgi:WD40-like Beta Propeller Repeat
VIRVARPDGTGDREVLPASAGAPVTSAAYAWSPSGTEIAYPCATGLCAVRVADGTTRRVVDLPSPSRATNPTWSPDGSRIAFGCPFIAPLCMVRPDGSDPITYTSGQGLLISFPDWSPDGTRILFSSRSSVYTFDVDDGEVRLLVDMGGESSARARWAPDGQSMLIRSFPDIYVMRFDGSQPTKIAEGSIGDWGTSPAATVADARAEPRWVLGRQVGSLVLTGTASHASDLQVTLRSATKQHPPISASAPAGEYRLTLKLPAYLLPGAYTVTVGGTSGGERLLDVVRSVQIEAPPAGIVARSWISASPTGPSRTRVPRATSRLFAHFEFSVRPANGQSVAAVWLDPSGSVRARQRVASARIARAAIVDDKGLAAGTWRCRLEAGRTVLAIATVRVG